MTIDAAVSRSRRLPPLATLLLTVALLCGAGWIAVADRSNAVDMTKAAGEFLDSLSAQERATALLPYEDDRRVDWHFIPKPARKGLKVGDMSQAQREAASQLLSTALSQVGYDKAKTIMSLEEILRVLEGAKGQNIRDPLRYYFTIFGEPVEKGRWGLSVEGHHLSLNFVVDSGRVVSHTPAFFGANPAIVKNEVPDSAPIGTRVLKAEEELAFELLGSLTPEQRKLAVIAAAAPRDIRAGGEPQPPSTAPEGIAVEKLNDAQKKVLRSLLVAYTEKMRAEISAELWSKIEQAGFDKIHYAWAGADQPGVGHYYRVQGPTFLVEFVNTQPDSAGNPANHIHSVWRDTSGDFNIRLKDHLHEPHE
jgi:hypothetical protein